MNRALNTWLKDSTKVQGVLGVAIRYPDKNNFSHSYHGDFPQTHMELAWRCMGDTFQVMKAHKEPAQRLRWVFEKAYLYCLSRRDGVCLGMFTLKDPDPEPDPKELDRIFNEFLMMRS